MKTLELKPIRLSELRARGNNVQQTEKNSGNRKMRLDCNSCNTGAQHEHDGSKIQNQERPESSSRAVPALRGNFILWSRIQREWDILCRGSQSNYPQMVRFGDHGKRANQKGVVMRLYIYIALAFGIWLMIHLAIRGGIR